MHTPLITPNFLAKKAFFHPLTVVLYPDITDLSAKSMIPALRNLAPPEKKGGMVSTVNLIPRYVDPHMMYTIR